MNDYTLNIQFFIGMNYFFQKELGNLDFFSFFSSKVAISKINTKPFDDFLEISEKFFGLVDSKLFRKFCEFRNYSVLIWDGIMENIYPCDPCVCYDYFMFQEIL